MSRRQVASDIFLAIADPTRRELLALLREGEQPVKTLAAHFDTTLSAVSQQIRVLRDAGLVEARQAGRERLYRINAEPLREVADWVHHYETFWGEKLDALAKYLAEESNEEETEGGEL